MTAADCGLPRDVVPPGNQTGKYYIPISNLPFNTTWQGLKDYIKPVCTVDHVEIFPKSTSGWVRVNGYKNFRAAFDHLNGKEFNGRAIIADDRNADKPLKVRDLVVSNTPGSTNRPSTSTTSPPISAPDETSHYMAGSPVSYSDSTVLSSPTSTTASMYGQSSRSYTMSMSPSSYMATPDTVYSQTVVPSWNTLASQSDPISAYGYGSATQSYYGYPTVPDGQQALYDHSPSYAVQPVQPYNEYGEYYASPTTMTLSSQFADLAVGTSSATGGGGVVYTEQRGIHIRDLSRRASEDQVRKLIREAAGREADLINGIEVPLDKDRNPRGWALVHFRSADLARRMVGVLDGAEFKGRKLGVRLLKEGETVGASGVTSASPPWDEFCRGHR
ncbi:hypothetical protein VSDG_04433 [Cytospora chrysosperma]|uniref:RRM domain-containing protein n=1 Tax=Cytospora chrysosperma TaxID=252740 RepID=A0A423W4D9_CYTCH|nr:hypothetical protein VSDG_04433 [Valsa sordida]